MLVALSESLSLDILRNHILRTGDAAVCILPSILTIHIELQLVILGNMTGKPALTLYIFMTVTIGFYFFQYINFLTEVRSHSKLSATI